MPLSWHKDNAVFAEVRGADPTLEWALGPGAEYVFGLFNLTQQINPPRDARQGPQANTTLSTLTPVIFAPEPLSDRRSELVNTIEAALKALRGDASLGSQSFLPEVAFPPEEQQAIRDGGPGAVFAPAAFSERIAADCNPAFRNLRDFPKRMQLGPPLRQNALPEISAANVRLPAPNIEPPSPGEPPDSGAPPRRTVFMGIIDDALPLAHRRFTLANGKTRFLAVWDQEADYDRQPDASAVRFGRELLAADIDAALQRARSNGLLDERAFYADSALAPFFRPERDQRLAHAAHGAHVLDAAAGRGPDDSEHPPQPIIAVKLPRASVLDTSGLELAHYIIRGARYVIERAKSAHKASEEKGRPRIVITISYGAHAGGYDAQSIIAQELDRLVCDHDADVAFVLPAGNTRLARAHQTLAGGQQTRLRLPPDDRTPTYVELWAPASGPSPTVVTVTAPGGASARVSFDEPEKRWQLRDGDAPVALLTVARPRGPDGRRLVHLAVAPTGAVRTKAFDNIPLAPCGDWTIEAHGKGALLLRIQRDDTLAGFRPRGRQAYILFDSDAEATGFRSLAWAEDNDPPCARIRTDQTFNDYATGEHVVVIGAHDSTTGRLRPYSAGGSLFIGADEHPPKPDATAPGDRSRWLAGMLTAGFWSGGRVAAGGTSIAAPQAAALIAAAWSDPACPKQARDIVRAGRDADGLPANRIGAGRLATHLGKEGSQTILPRPRRI